MSNHATKMNESMYAAPDHVDPQHTRPHRGRSPGASLAVRGFRLLLVEGPRAGEEWAASGDRASIGSHESNDLVLDDPTVSRFHCEVTMTPEGPRLRDLGSLNGTVLDGVAVFDALLRDGATLAMGASVVRFHFRSDSSRVELSPDTRFGRMIGRAPAMRATFALLERAARSNATVLLEGETGTGKGAAAASLHTASSRGDAPFVALDCSAIPPSLLESELFGHERGAFTGATIARPGVFEAANGGTVFLDEIGEMQLDLQPKLLRVLEDREVRRVGTNVARKVDVRVIAATNRDLRAEVNAGRVRADLFFRLAVLRVQLPPLRQRAEDVPLLVESILSSLGASAPEREALTTPAFLAQLQAARWPGNVRELRNCIERCLVFQEARVDCDEPSCSPSMVAEAAEARIDARVPYAAAREHAIERFEREYVQSLLALHAGNVTAAAQAAGFGRVYLHKLMRRHGVR
jgi:DNA-binding NtrC family response regulator